ncbi:MAG: ribosomal protein S18-alanine N-acetyltransferase [Alphaproteobacteria bacterium]|nr:ribosomal protein S18-alanine N-acetyltransferase [Alphaproteobacteria bacterium]
MKTIAELGPEAAGLFAELHARCFTDPWNEAAMMALLSSPGVTGLALEAGGRPTGLALVRAVAGEAEILTIGVLPEARGSGLGAQLLSACIEAARKADCERLFLEVSDINAPAVRLYEAAGFTETGRRARYYRDGSDARLMALSL